jgi:uncharacterized membrane protein (DUF2068 family)
VVVGGHAGVIEMKAHKCIRAVAIFEASKGLLVLLAGFGLFSLIHHDVQLFAEKLVAHLHLNPAKHYPHIFIDAAANLTDAGLQLLAAFAFIYGSVRFIEAYGLWYERRWAEWLAAIGGAVYIPFEVYELCHKAGWISLVALAINVLIVGVMVSALRQTIPP